MKLKRIGMFALAAFAALGLASCDKKNDDQNKNKPTDPVVDPGVDPTDPEDELELVTSGDYTYHSYGEALGDNWNPHTWEVDADNTILSYLSVGFVDMTIKDSEKQEYQWIYEMAESVEDVTSKYQSDLTKYKSALPEGKKANEVTSGYVYQIKLNKNAKWENGEAINADTYVESMKRLLHPEMLNYRANLYISGESAIAGAYQYYYSKTEGLYVGVESLGYKNNAAAVADGKTLYLDAWGFWGAKGYTDAEGNECPQWIPVTDTVEYGAAQNDPFTAAELYATYGAYLEVGAAYAQNVGIYQVNEDYDPDMGYDVVGLYKVDDYTINYVLQTAEAKDYFFTSLTSTWLVYTPLYDRLTKQVGTLKTTTYGSDLESSISYGPYKMTSFEAEKQIVFERNPYWYGYQKTEDGYLYSVTNFEVDGKKVQQYITNKIVIDVETKQSAKQRFLKGELDEWAPEPTEVPEYNLSSQMYKVDETYTWRLFFNTNERSLEAMENAGTNTNGQVLTNEKFRKALSLSIDRADYVTATAGNKPATYLMNSLYYYNVFEDPTSSYRSSEQAMKAIVDFYGYEYGAGKNYATLEEAFNAITGYNLTEAKALMKQAHDELVAAGKYTTGSDIKITLAWQKAAMDATANALVAKLEGFFNAAAEGSGFGHITLEGKGSLTDRYKDVINGTYAIGYGAWGGAAFYPFRTFQVYMDPDQYDIHEAGCWDPSTETLTLTINGQEVTKTWQNWSRCMVGTGDYANADFNTKLYITAQLEAKFMAKYYCIPLCTDCSVSLLSYKVNYYTEDYNIMYGFGGLRLMSYNYNDAEWTAYVAKQGGTLNYK